VTCTFNLKIKFVAFAIKNSGCRIGACCAAIFLYADDIILLAPSVSTVQTLVTICELELIDIDMVINIKKSACIRFGLRSKSVVAAGVNIDWVTLTSGGLF